MSILLDWKKYLFLKQDRISFFFASGPAPIFATRHKCSFDFISGGKLSEIFKSYNFWLGALNQC